MYLNASIPIIYCKIRAEFLYNLEDHGGEYIDCCVFGVASVPHRAIMFHCMTMNGAQIARMPINAFCHKECEKQEIFHLEMWDSFSYDVSVTTFEYLKNMRCEVRSRDKKWYEGAYLFTLDWCGDNFSENPGDGGHKNAHIIQLDSGNFAAMPNNRIYWYEPSEIAVPLKLMKEGPKYKTNEHVWKCENDHAWATDDSDEYFYEDRVINREAVITPGSYPAEQTLKPEFKYPQKEDG